MILLEYAKSVASESRYLREFFKKVYCATAESIPLSDAVILNSAASDVHASVSNDTPIQENMQELCKLCDAYEKPGQQRDKKKKETFSLEWQCYAGRSIRALTTKEVQVWPRHHARRHLLAVARYSRAQSSSKVTSSHGSEGSTRHLLASVTVFD